MLEALWIVRQFPRQIRRDLDRYHGRRLADWWRGTERDGELVLSSSELLDYIEFLDEDGAFKRAVRSGGYSRLEGMIADTHNEVAWLRASYHAVNGGEKGVYKPNLHFDPRVEEIREREARENAELQMDIEAEIFGAFEL